jgi:perosamine synthetase
VNTVLHARATPVLADIEKDSWTIDINQCETLITEKTKAIMPVHLYGQPCNMNKVVSFAQKYNLKIIEDCAEAHGARYENRTIGSFGDISCFSFYGNKIITCGEGGICLTDDKQLAEKMKTLRDHGMNIQKRYWHDFVGYNYRITNLQAAIGSAQMETINLFLEKRKKIAYHYTKRLKDHPLITLQNDFDDREKVCWLYSLLIDTKTVGKSIVQIQNELKKCNIDSRPFFYPVNKMPIYQDVRHNGLNNSVTISENGISLPTFVDLTAEQIDYISSNLIEILNGS